MDNDRDNATTETSLTWARSKQLGSEGMTHTAATEVGEDSFSFTVDSPRKGYWVARGWKNGDFDLYREARTMKDAKAQVQAYADRLALAAARAEARKAERQDAWQAAWQAEWDSRPSGADVSDLIEIVPITGTLPDGREGAADHKAAEAEDVAQLSGGLVAADPAPLGRALPGEGAELLDIVRMADAIPVDLPDVVRPFTHMAEQLTNYMPRAVQRAAKAMRQFDWHMRRPCTCPTPSHRMSCGQGGRVTVVG